MGVWRVLSASVGLAVTIAGLASLPAAAADAQLLATGCTGCHTSSDTVATAIPKIRGMPEPVFLETMRAFRAGQRAGTVMDRIVKGLTEDEVRQLAAYFGARR